MHDNRLRAGVVGLGKMGLLHTSILNVLPNVELAAVCEKSSLIRRLGKKVLKGIPVVEDVTDFSGLNLDLVYVTTPIPSHFSVTQTVYNRHLARHVFVEKPLASNFAESKELCSLSLTNGGTNMVGYLRRFMITFMKAKDLLAQRHIGSPHSFTINAFSSDFSEVRNNPKPSIARGGVLRDLGSYAIDLSLLFFGSLQLDSAKVEGITGNGAEDTVNFDVHREVDNLKGAASVSWCMDGYRMPEVNLSIKGDLGSIEVNDDMVILSTNQEKTVWFRHNLEDNVDFWLGGPEYYREDAYFIKSIMSGLNAEPSFKTASAVDSFIEKILEKANAHA